MARPLRVNIEDGWYHITSRGIERRRIFTEDSERKHFLELLEEMSERYRVRVHAYVLMDNHYHLLIQTPQANASQAIHWLGVSYSVWFNRRHNRVGPLFQGRFKSVLIDGEGSWALIASEYVHLNPVRISSLGLGKYNNRAEAEGLTASSKKTIQERLKMLREYAWSSYGAYAGYRNAQKWLVRKVLLRRAGGRDKYRKGVEAYIRRGSDIEGTEKIKSQLAIGAQDFINKVKKMIKDPSQEQPERKILDSFIEFDEVVEIVENNKREKWQDFVGCHGDWGRDLVLYLARQRSGLTLKQIGERAGKMGYKAVDRAVQRFKRKLEKDKKLSALAKKCLTQL